MDKRMGWKRERHAAAANGRRRGCRIARTTEWIQHRAISAHASGAIITKTWIANKQFATVKSTQSTDKTGLSRGLVTTQRTIR